MQNSVLAKIAENVPTNNCHLEVVTVVIFIFLINILYISLCLGYRGWSSPWSVQEQLPRVSAQRDAACHQERYR